MKAVIILTTLAAAASAALPPLPPLKPLQPLQPTQRYQPFQPLKPFQPQPSYQRQLQPFQQQQSFQPFRQPNAFQPFQQQKSFQSFQQQPLKPLQPLQPLKPLQPLQPLQRQQPFQPFQRPQSLQALRPLQPLGRTQPIRPVQTASYQSSSPQYLTRYATSFEDGQYRHDGTGHYVHDNSGDYIHQDVPYEHQDVPYEHQDIGGGEYVHPVYVEGIPPAGGYGPPVALRQGNAAGLYDNRNYKIIRKIEHVGEDLYDYLYETENGIYAEEDGKIANKNTKDEAIRAKGYFTYTGPDSIIYTVNYTADENGFLPEADHLPTPPPLPEAIARSLAYQRAIGELEDKR